MILIYSNTGEWGGVDMLIAGYAKHLQSQGKSFKIVEPSSGRLRSQVASEFFIECNAVADIAAEVTHVFFPSISKIGDDRFPWAAFPDAKAFAWIVHPNDAFSRFFPYSGKSLGLLGYRAAKILRLLFRKHQALLSRMMTLLVDNNAVATMDGATTRAVHFFFPELSKTPHVVPIPSVPADPIQPREPELVLSVGYLGRMDAMKWSAIHPFLKRSLAPISKTRPVELHAVTEGACVEDLRKACVELGIKIQLSGYLPNTDARRWLAERCHVAVAMGTSALDLAGVGMPVVVLDPALTKFTPHQSKFRFVHDSLDFTVGEYRDFPGYVAGRNSFTALCDASRLVQASKDGRSYVRNEHDPDVCYELLDSLIAKSSLRVSQLAILARDVMTSFSNTKRRSLRVFVGSRHG